MTVVRDYFQSRTVPVPKLLFPSTTGTVLDVDNLNGLFTEMCESAGIEAYTLYDLRHTYASLLLMRGASPQYVQRQLGHETLSTTLRYYAHWIPKETKESCAHLIDANPTSAVFSPKCFVNAEFRLCFVTISALSRLPYAMFSPASLLLLGSGAWRRFRGGLVLLPSPFGCAALDPLSSAKR